MTWQHLWSYKINKIHLHANFAPVPCEALILNTPPGLEKNFDAYVFLIFTDKFKKLGVI